RAAAITPDLGLCVDTATSRLGRSRRIFTASVSFGVAPSTWNGPTSPGRFPPALSYHSPQRGSLSTISPGLTFSTCWCFANVGYHTVCLTRYLSVRAFV